MESDVVTGSVNDVDDEGVAVTDMQSWPWELAIDCDYVVVSAQPLHRCCLNLKNTFICRNIITDWDVTPK